MDEIIQRCTNCSNVPEDILMLGCEHDLCLNCAALIFMNESSNHDGDGKLLTCIQCGKATELDDSSVLELRKIHVELLISAKIQEQEKRTNSRSNHQAQQQHQNNQDQRYQSQKQNQQNFHQYSIAQKQTSPRHIQQQGDSRNVLNRSQLQQQHSSSMHSSNQYGYNSVQNVEVYSHDTSVNSTRSNKMQQLPNNHRLLNSQVSAFESKQQLQQQVQQFQGQQSKRFCTDHTEEEIMYYCFQCSSRCICPECVIHGAHKNHEVKTIKKAFPVIKQKVDEFLQKMDIKMKMIASRTTQIQSFYQELEGNSISLRKQVGLLFQELREKINEKEREIQQMCESVLMQNLKEIDNLNINLEDKQSDFLGTINLVKDHAEQPDETLLLDFYATNQQKLEEIKENREWEKQLIQTTPTFLEIDSRDLQKSILLLETALAQIDPTVQGQEDNNQQPQQQYQQQSQTQLQQQQQQQQQKQQQQFQQTSPVSSPKQSQHINSQFSIRNQPAKFNIQKEFDQGNSHTNNQNNQKKLLEQKSIPSPGKINDSITTKQRDQKISNADFDKFREVLANAGKKSLTKQGQEDLSDSMARNSQIIDNSLQILRQQQASIQQNYKSAGFQNGLKLINQNQGFENDNSNRFQSSSQRSNSRNGLALHDPFQSDQI